MANIPENFRYHNTIKMFVHLTYIEAICLHEDTSVALFSVNNGK